jgi:hypothetical protein
MKNHQNLVLDAEHIPYKYTKVRIIVRLVTTISLWSVKAVLTYVVGTKRAPDRMVTSTARRVLTKFLFVVRIVVNMYRKTKQQLIIIAEYVRHVETITIFLVNRVVISNTRITHTQEQTITVIVNRVTRIGSERVKNVVMYTTLTIWMKTFIVQIVVVRNTYIATITNLDPSLGV